MFPGFQKKSVLLGYVLRGYDARIIVIKGKQIKDGPILVAEISMMIQKRLQMIIIENDSWLVVNSSMARPVYQGHHKLSGRQQVVNISLSEH